MPASKTATRPPAAAFRPPSEDAAQPAWDAIPSPKRTEFIPIKDIARDERVNTRPVNVAWVHERTGENFHPEALGTPIVSRRPDNQIVVLDGQNRIALCREVGWQGWAGDGRIECEVHEGLNLVSEAGMFILLAGHRSFTPMSKFLARKTQEDPDVLAIIGVVERNGYHLGTPASGDTIAAVTTLEKIWNADRKNNPDTPPGQLTALNSTLFTIVSAWQYTDGATDQAVIGGIGMLFLKYGSTLLAGQPERDLLVEALAAYPRGPEMLKANAAGARATIKGNLSKAVAFTAGQAYDKRQPKWGKRLNFAVPR